jgi:hypothetical protein
MHEYAVMQARKQPPGVVGQLVQMDKCKDNYCGRGQLLRNVHARSARRCPGWADFGQRCLLSRSGFRREMSRFDVVRRAAGGAL